MFAPDSEDADQEGQGGHNHLPGLGGAELPVTPEHFPEARGEHGDDGDRAGGQGTARPVTREGSETQYFMLLTKIHLVKCIKLWLIRQYTVQTGRTSGFSNQVSVYAEFLDCKPYQKFPAILKIHCPSPMQVS